MLLTKSIKSGKKLSGTFLQPAVILIVAAMFSFIFLTLSPLHPWKMGDTGSDSAVFKTVSMMIGKGYMPYRDSFDFMGPLLYIINLAGDRIAFYRGVWMMEFISLLITTIMLYRTSRLSCGCLGAVISTFSSFALMFMYFTGGNQPEEYALPFIAAAQFIFLDYIINARISALRTIVSGMCLGAVLLLRFEAAALWFSFCLFLLPASMISKERQQMIKYPLLFSAGVVAVLSPFMIWLSAGGALSSFFNDYIRFNWTYVSEYITCASQVKSFFSFCNNPVYIVAAAGLILNLKRNMITNTVYLAYMALILIFISTMGPSYEHFGLLSAPAAVYPVSLIFADVESLPDIDIRRILLMLISVLAILFLTPSWLEIVQPLPEMYSHRRESSLPEPERTIAGIIDENSDPSDKISVYGNWDIIYVMSRRDHATQYSYQFPINTIAPEAEAGYFSQLRNEQPKYIIIQADHMDNTMKGFLRDNNYVLFWSLKEDDENTAMIYEKL